LGSLPRDGPRPGTVQGRASPPPALAGDGPRTRWSTSAGRSPADTGCCWPRSAHPGRLAGGPGRLGAARRRPRGPLYPVRRLSPRRDIRYATLAELPRRPGHPARPDAQAGGLPSAAAGCLPGYARRAPRVPVRPPASSSWTGRCPGPVSVARSGGWRRGPPCTWAAPSGRSPFAEAEVAAGRNPRAARTFLAVQPWRGRRVPAPPAASTCCGRTATCRTARQSTAQPRWSSRWSGFAPRFPRPDPRPRRTRHGGDGTAQPESRRRRHRGGVTAACRSFRPPAGAVTAPVGGPRCPAGLPVLGEPRRLVAGVHGPWAAYHGGPGWRLPT